MTDTKTMPLQMVFIGKEAELARAFVNGDRDGCLDIQEELLMRFKGTINYLDDEFPFKRFTTLPGRIAQETGIMCIEKKDGRLIFWTWLGGRICRILKYYAPCDTATIVDTLE